MAICAGWDLRIAMMEGAKLLMTSVSICLEKVLISFIFVLHLDCSEVYILCTIESRWGRAWVPILRRAKLKLKKNL